MGRRRTEFKRISRLKCRGSSSQIIFLTLVSELTSAIAGVVCCVRRQRNENTPYCTTCQVNECKIGNYVGGIAVPTRTWTITNLVANAMQLSSPCPVPRLKPGCVSNSECLRRWNLSGFRCVVLGLVYSRATVRLGYDRSGGPETGDREGKSEMVRHQEGEVD